MKKYLFLLLLLGCGRAEHGEQSHSLSKTETLKVRVEQVKADMSLPGNQLWEPVLDCDYTLWAGEAAAAGLEVDLSAMEYKPGQIERRPVKTCWPGKDDGAVSTVSNDALTGKMIGDYEKGDLSALERLADYAADHAYIMGAPAYAVGDVLMKLPLQALLGKMIYALSGGASDRRIRHMPADYGHVKADYAQHIQAVQIVWHGIADAKLLTLGVTSPKEAISSGMFDRLKESYAEHPENYFFASALAVYDGSYDRALDLLLLDDPGRPSYVRGERPEIMNRVHWLLAAKLVLDHYEAPQ